MTATTTIATGAAEARPTIRSLRLCALLLAGVALAGCETVATRGPAQQVAVLERQDSAVTGTNIASLTEVVRKQSPRRQRLQHTRRGLRPRRASSVRPWTISAARSSSTRRTRRPTPTAGSPCGRPGATTRRSPTSPARSPPIRTNAPALIGARQPAARARQHGRGPHRSQRRPAREPGIGGGAPRPGAGSPAARPASRGGARLRRGDRPQPLCRRPPTRAAGRA